MHDILIAAIININILIYPLAIDIWIIKFKEVYFNFRYNYTRIKDYKNIGSTCCHFRIREEKWRIKGNLLRNSASSKELSINSKHYFKLYYLEGI